MLSARQAQKATPNDTLPGDCGVSWVYIGYQNTAAKPYLMTTGFTLNTFPAVSVDWWVHIDGPSGYYYSYKAGPYVLPSPAYTWRGSHGDNGAFGRWSAQVDTLSWAVDASGGVCSSAGPSDSHSL
jgi:hypothetical protein